MSTRGALGVVVNGQTKITYNHSDSYPSGLGVGVSESIRAFKGNLAKMREQALALRLVRENSKPSAADKARFGDPEAADWYWLLRDLQGDLKRLLDAGVMTDAAGFLSDSLFCEWAYLVNLDDGVLEVYRGFQKKPHGLGRYAAEVDRKQNKWREKRGIGQYYPVALVATFPLSRPPTTRQWAKLERDQSKG